MKKIQMVDLNGQYQKIKHEVDEAIMDVISSTAFINGPEVKLFQHELEQYLNVEHVITCANGTDALQIAMMALNLQPGDEVITASFTYVATAEVIALLKLTPVLVDVDPRTFNIDPNAIEAAITSKTKAIVPVHLFGQCADMETILKIATQYGLFVIEDVAQATGASYTFTDGTIKKAGTMGTIGCTSFFPSKNLGCFGDGGAIFVNDKNLSERVRMIANHGQRVQYIHDIIGVNSRLDSIQAAVLRIKLKHLNKYTEARVAVANYYDLYLSKHAKITIPYRSEKSEHVFHQYTIQVPSKDRTALREYLSKNEIPAMVYYPIPLHKQKAFNDAHNKQKFYPISETLCESVLSLPISTEMDTNQLEYINYHINTFLNR